MNKGKLYRKLFTLAVMLCCLYFVAGTGNTRVTSAALCCSWCDQQDLEICLWKPDAAICEGCRRCSPLC